MTTPMEALEQLRVMTRSGQLVVFCQERGIDLFVAFGSAVDRGRIGAPNDLDVAVRFGHEPDGPWGIGGIVADLMGLLELSEVDVMDLGRAGIVARANALGGGELLYERRRGSFAREQMRALGQAMERGWLTELSLRTMADR